MMPLATETQDQIDRVLADMQRSLDDGIVPLQIYGDAGIYALELERIFNRSWIFVAHESELPERGDFVRRFIGDGQWIIVRGDDGAIRALFDSCRHRGVHVCSGDRGRTSAFHCPYHGWTYKNDGTLIGVPNRGEAFKEIDTRSWSLHEAPQLSVFCGLIFACLEPEAPTLLEHLGDFRWYLETHFGAAHGMVVVGDPHRWIVPANWKTACENFSGDSYHTPTLHRSIVEIGLVSTLVSGSYDVHVTECSGHACSIRRLPPGADSFWGYPPEVHEDFRAGSLSASQLDLARGSINTVATVFPNMSIIHAAMKAAPSEPPSGFLSLRQWRPISADRMEIWSWVLVPSVASAEYRTRAYRSAVATFSPSGNFEADDAAVWGGIAHSAGSVFAKKQRLTLNFEMGLDGMSDAKIIPDWPGPGIVYDSRLEEGTHRTFLRHWLAEVSRP
jgi:phenylpropionate dioxygenase-like ring-hydroxylating dioxygenase large terminal subunit